MKKLLLFGAALTFIFSACNPLDLLDPIPQPGKGQIYVQAKVAQNGEELCGLAIAGPPFDAYATIGLADELFVNPYLTDNFVAVPFGAGGTVKIWIESTLPNITLKPTDVDHYWTPDILGSPLVANLIPPANYTSVEQDGEKFVITLNDGAADALKISWLRKTYEVGVVNWTMPAFSQYIEITRIGHSDVTYGYGGGIVHVKAEGAAILGNDPCYTGFKVIFGDDNSMLNLILAAATTTLIPATLPTTTIPITNVGGGEYEFTLPTAFLTARIADFAAYSGVFGPPPTATWLFDGDALTGGVVTFTPASSINVTLRARKALSPNMDRTKTFTIGFSNAQKALWVEDALESPATYPVELDESGAYKIALPSTDEFGFGSTITWTQTAGHVDEDYVGIHDGYVFYDKPGATFIFLTATITVGTAERVWDFAAFPAL